MDIKLGLRKIQGIRGSAFVNIPKIWMDSCSLRKGEKVAITLLEDGSLRISVGTLESDAIGTR